MRQNVPLKNILFLDIETVGQGADFAEVPERLQVLWHKKAALLDKEANEAGRADLYAQRAGIYAEFGKVVAIAVGVLQPQTDGPPKLVVKAFSDHAEGQLLRRFAELLSARFSKDTLLCGHNIKEFDIPFLCRRMLINGVDIPPVLNVMGRKPWEVPHIDTMEMWRFGDKRSYVSLELLAASLDVPSSKDDIDGSQVHEVYYAEQDLDRIARYCMQDVAVTANVYMRMQGMALVPDQLVTFRDSH